MTDPKDLSYELTRRENIAETAELRVRILTPGEDEKVPWHDHSEITDTFICLEGPVVVETRAPRARHELVQGDRLAVPPMTAHEVRGKDGRGCRFVIVQGIGTHDFIPVGGGIRSRPPQDEQKMETRLIPRSSDNRR
ncbi:MAG: cupin domain-containing protein [Kiloniellales bacterium]|nr:cupin domain-containing protein [Kiloniellales bacterium]